MNARSSSLSPKGERVGVRGRRRALMLGVICALSAWFAHSLDGTLHHRQPSHLLLDRTGKFLGEVPGSHEAWGFWPVPEVLPNKIVITTLETEDRNFNE